MSSGCIQPHASPYSWAAPARRGSREGSGLAGGSCFITCVVWGLEECRTRLRCWAVGTKQCCAWCSQWALTIASPPSGHLLGRHFPAPLHGLSTGRRCYWLQTHCTSRKQTPPEPGWPSVGIHSSNREPLAEWGQARPWAVGAFACWQKFPQVWLPPCPNPDWKPGPLTPDDPGPYDSVQLVALQGCIALVVVKEAHPPWPDAPGL